MKLVFRIVLVATVLPVLFGLLGMLLSWAFSCSGMDHIEACAVSWGRAPAAFFIAFVWISVFVVPVGSAILVLLWLVQRVLAIRTHREG